MILSVFTPSPIAWDNDNFIDSSFWALNPSDDDIVKALYVDESDYDTAYTTNWSGYDGTQCTDMKVEYISDVLPWTLSDNTIYVLTTWAMDLSYTVNLWTCTTVISQVESGTSINFIKNIDAWLYVWNNKTYAIMDNINILKEWNKYIDFWIFVEWSKITINNVYVSNFDTMWLYLLNSNYNLLNNIIVTKCWYSWIYFESCKYNKTNNYTCYNTAYMWLAADNSSFNCFYNILVYDIYQKDEGWTIWAI